MDVLVTPQALGMLTSKAKTIWRFRRTVCDYNANAMPRRIALSVEIWEPSRTPAGNLAEYLLYVYAAVSSIRLTEQG